MRRRYLILHGSFEIELIIDDGVLASNDQIYANSSVAPNKIGSQYEQFFNSKDVDVDCGHEHILRRV